MKITPHARTTLALALITSIAFLPTPKAKAESTVHAYVQRESIWDPPHIMVNGRAVYHHFFTGFDELPDAMNDNPEAVKFAERANRQAIWGSSFLWGGLAAALIYGASNTEHFDPGTYWALFGVGFIPGVLLLASSEVNVNKAMNVYNGIEEHYSLKLTPVVNGGVASLEWTF